MLPLSGEVSLLAIAELIELARFANMPYSRSVCWSSMTALAFEPLEWPGRSSVVALSCCCRPWRAVTSRLAVHAEVVMSPLALASSAEGAEPEGAR